MMKSKSMEESKYAHKLSRCEAESLIGPLKDKEPTPAWRQQLNNVLVHLDSSLQQMIYITTLSNRRNLLGRPYSFHTYNNMIQHYHDKTNGWTKNAAKTVNDHLDSLIDYFSKEEEPQNDIYQEPIETKPEPTEIVSPTGSVLETSNKGEESPFAKAVKAAFNNLEAKPKRTKVKLTKVHIIRRKHTCR